MLKQRKKSRGFWGDCWHTWTSAYRQDGAEADDDELQLPLNVPGLMLGVDNFLWAYVLTWSFCVFSLDYSNMMAHYAAAGMYVLWKLAKSSVSLLKSLYKL